MIGDQRRGLIALRHFAVDVHELTPEREPAQLLRRGWRRRRGDPVGPCLEIAGDARDEFGLRLAGRAVAVGVGIVNGQETLLELGLGNPGQFGGDVLRLAAGPNP